MRNLNKNSAATANLLCGLYSKKEAANHVVSGVQHIHSSTLGQKDPLAKLTQKAIETGNVPVYPWEVTTTAKTISLLLSATRHELIHKILADLGVETKREFSEKISGVLEELISNSIYHAYSDANGDDKYSRKSSVSLSENERVLISYAWQPTGVFLSVQDQGGVFPFRAIANAFERCYGPKKNQIDAKESGAGLGLYMIYEYATHLKIECNAGKQTRTSCWLSDKKNYDPDYFSINYFDRGQK